MLTKLTTSHKRYKDKIMHQTLDMRESIERLTPRFPVIIKFSTISDINVNLKDPLFNNSFFIVLSSIFNAGCGFLFWMLAAKLYSVESVGQATALISFLGLVVLFSRLGFDISIIRFLPYSDKVKIFNTSLTITTAASLIIGMIYVLLIDFISPSLAFIKQPDYTLAFLLVGTASSIASITGSAFLASRMGDHYLYQNIFMALRVPLLIPLAFLGAFGTFGSVGLSYLVASAIALIVLRRKLPGLSLKVDIEFIKKSFIFSSWSYISNILIAAPTLILPIMVLNMLGEAEAAKYYIAMTIGNLVLIIPNALSTSLLVEGSHGKALKKNAILAGMACIALLVPTVLVLCIFGRNFLGLLKENYVNAFELLKILALSSFLVTAYSIFIAIQNVRMRVESIVKFNLIRCMLLLGLSYVLIIKYGIMGAGYGWIITYGIITLGIGWVIKREI